jgi:hypothetical protein
VSSTVFFNCLSISAQQPADVAIRKFPFSMRRTFFAGDPAGGTHDCSRCPCMGHKMHSGVGDELTYAILPGGAQGPALVAWGGSVGDTLSGALPWLSYAHCAVQRTMRCAVMNLGIHHAPWFQCSWRRTGHFLPEPELVRRYHTQ